MLGAHPIEVALGSTYDRVHLKTILAAMSDAGLAAFFCKPDSKEPAPHMVMATVTYNRAKRAGENLGHGMATPDKAMLHRWLKRWRDTQPDDVQPNIGINPGPSRLLIVDVDTMAERQAFLDYWCEKDGWDFDPDVEWQDITPTVLTPGQRDAEGNWTHKDGGHYYFTLPEGVSVPTTGPGVVKMPGGWAIYRRDCYVLAPPSVRPEGPYLLAGKVRQAPGWLLEAAGVSSTDDQADTDAPAADDPAGADTGRGDVPPTVDPDDERHQSQAQSVDDWASGQDWHSLLTDRGYRAYKPDKCGPDCMMYIAPGVHASPKSATAHGATCTIYDPTMGHGPLHFWTDNAPDGFEGKGTYTMLQFLARADYGGDMAAALDGLGIAYSTFDLKRLDGLVDKEVPDTIIRPARFYIDTPPPQPLVDGYLFRQSHAVLVGEPGAGKSFAGLDLAASIATGTPWHRRQVHQGPVIYLAGEGFAGFVQRMHAWSDALEQPNMWDQLHIVRDIQALPLHDPRADASVAREWWAKFLDEAARMEPELIVMDTFAKVTAGMKENDAGEMSRAMGMMADVIEHLSTTVLMVHHTAKTTNHARGSSVLLGAVDTELLLVKDGTIPKGVNLITTKQKDAAEADPLGLVITPYGSSAYIAEPSLKTIEAAAGGAEVRNAVVAFLGQSDRVKVRVTDIALQLSSTWSKQAVQSAVDALLADGTLEHPQGARGQNLTTSVQLKDISKTPSQQGSDTDNDNGNDKQDG